MKKIVLLLTAILAFTAASLYAQDAKTHLDNGNKLLDQRDYDGAIRELTEAIRLDPKYALAYYNRGRSYANKNDYDRAIADYTEAIRLDPKNAMAYRSRGEAYITKSDLDRAIADFTETIRFDPKNAEAYHSRGRAYYFKNDYDRAIAEYNEAIRLDPKYALAYNSRGIIYLYDKNDYDRAIKDFEAALQILPNLFRVRENLAEAKKIASEIISVTAKDLESAYDSNQLRADAQYKDKLVKVTGKVIKVGNDQIYGNYIQLDNLQVYVYIKSSELNKAIALNKGQTVTLTGTCIGRPYLLIQINDAVFSN